MHQRLRKFGLAVERIRSVLKQRKSSGSPTAFNRFADSAKFFKDAIAKLDPRILRITIIQEDPLKWVAVLCPFIERLAAMKPSRPACPKQCQFETAAAPVLARRYYITADFTRRMEVMNYKYGFVSSSTAKSVQLLFERGQRRGRKTFGREPHLHTFGQ